MPEKDSKEKENQMRRLGGKGGLGNDSKQSSYEGKDRLTARASLRRRTIEKAVLKENVCSFLVFCGFSTASNDSMLMPYCC